MPRKLKTYQTSLGFFDLAVAAPSMKAALQAWGSSQNLFHQGMARESSDPAVIAATMAKPGIVLKRPVGGGGSFKEQADLPTNLPASKPKKSSRRPTQAQKPAARPVVKAKNDLAMARPDDRRGERKPGKAEQKAEFSVERRRQAQAIAAAKLALESAERTHRQNLARIERQRAELDREERREASRWDRERERHEAALRRLAQK